MPPQPAVTRAVVAPTAIPSAVTPPNAVSGVALPPLDAAGGTSMMGGPAARPGN
jgi:hypothetical protein